MVEGFMAANTSYYPCLVITHGSQQGRKIQINQPSVNLGRGPEAQIVIDYPNVSRLHAQITFWNDSWCLVDLNSKNGVYLNAFRLESGKRVVLNHDDEIRLGTDCILKFWLLAAPAEAQIQPRPTRNITQGTVVSPVLSGEEPGNNPDSINLLRQGIVALREGDKAAAFHYLMGSLKKNPRNADAWYLLADTQENPNDKRECLKRALKCNPEHRNAKAKLSLLDTGSRTSVSPQPATLEPINKVDVNKPMLQPSPLPVPSAQSQPVLFQPALPPRVSVDQTRDDYLAAAIQKYPKEEQLKALEEALLPKEASITPPLPDNSQQTAHFCPDCAAPLPPGAQVCSNCGHSTSSPPVGLTPDLQTIQNPTLTQNGPPNTPAKTPGIGRVVVALILYILTTYLLLKMVATFILSF